MLAFVEEQNVQTVLGEARPSGTAWTWGNARLTLEGRSDRLREVPTSR